MSARGRTSIAVIVIITFTAGVLAATFGTNVIGIADRTGSDARAQVSQQDGAVTPIPATPMAFEDTFVEIAETVNPSVVQIRSERVTRREGVTTNPFEGTPFEHMFPRNMPPQEFRSDALGSGVLISPEGHIITNNHVISEAEELEVHLYDGESYDAEVVGTDPNSDLAVIKITADRDLPTVRFGSFEDIRIGQWVLAFGSPLSEDLGNTVTAGIVSAIGRTSQALSRLNTFSSFIQTDAAINPGNSGGPLVNLRGELVGINSAIFSRSGGYQGVGFAIPVDVVKNVTTQLIETGEVRRGFLGVMFGPVSDALSEAIGVPRGAAQIESVTEGSAADKADLQAGDIIVAVDGMTLRDFNELRTTIANKLPGETVRLSIVRDGDEKDISVKLGTRDEEALAQNESGGQGDSRSPESLEALGLTLQNSTPEMLQRLGFSDQNLGGVIIASIDRGSDAYREADLREGDLITEIDRKPVANRQEFERVYASIDSDESFLVRVLRPVGQTTRSFITALTKPGS